MNTNKDWLDIASAPKDGSRIAIKFASGNEHEANWRTTYGGEWHVDSFKYLPWADQHEITHWKPLPADPCPTCNDQGAVGNILTAEPCPDCSPGSPASTVATEGEKDEKPYCYALETRGEHNGVADVLLDVEYNGADSFSHGRKGGFPLYRRPAPAAGDALDAQRYRWLREPQTDVALVLDKRTGYVPEDESVPGVGGYHTYEYRAGEELDAAIDAAIAQQSQRKEA